MVSPYTPTSSLWKRKKEDRFIFNRWIANWKWHECFYNVKSSSKLVRWKSPNWFNRSLDMPKVGRKSIKNTNITAQLKLSWTIYCIQCTSTWFISLIVLTDSYVLCMKLNTRIWKMPSFYLHSFSTSEF